MNNEHITKKDLTQELEKFAQIVIDKNAEQIQVSRAYTVNLLTGIVHETEERISKRIEDVVSRVDRCEAGIESLNGIFVHAAEFDRTVIEKIEREKADQGAINGKVNMRLLRLEIGPKPRKRFA